ncbi:MAG: linked oxidase domain protein [Frankiales bacterium]|nr:linked oxidase domain protein [Frankiales bacterium]
MKALADIVGSEHVLVDSDVKASYETDWTQRFTGSAVCVVRPGTTDEVAAVVRACVAEGLRITVQGGNTGLVGGGVPAGGEVLMSLTRLTALGDVDRASSQVTAGAGVTLAVLQARARDAGFDVGVDLAARDSATVGGLVATNAGGIRVLRYGSMRQQVLGLTAVMPDGSVISRMAGLEKDGTGYDLMGLIAGSEGTLAVITEVRVRLVPRYRARAVALLAMSSTAAAVAVLPGLRAALPSLAAAELFYAPGLALVRKHGGLPAPFPEEHEAYLLVECADLTDPTTQLVAAVESADGLVDARIADDASGQRALWAYREAHTESISAEGVPVKLDVSVPITSLPALVEQLEPVIAGVCPGARAIVFGHVNEGNLHVNVLDSGDLHEEVTDAVLRLVASLDGSISSEHGVGRAKVPWLGLSRSSTEIDTMRAIKRALDPAGTLNPGVLFP